MHAALGPQGQGHGRARWLPLGPATMTPTSPFFFPWFPKSCCLPLSLSPPLGPPIQIRLVKGCQRTFLPTTSEDQHNHPVDLYTLVPGLSSPG